MPTWIMALDMSQALLAVAHDAAPAGHPAEGAPSSSAVWRLRRLAVPYARAGLASGPLAVSTSTMSWMVRNGGQPMKRRNHQQAVCQRPRWTGGLRQPPPERAMVRVASSTSHRAAFGGLPRPAGAGMDGRDPPPPLVRRVSRVASPFEDGLPGSMVLGPHQTCLRGRSAQTQLRQAFLKRGPRCLVGYFNFWLCRWVTAVDGIGPGTGIERLAFIECTTSMRLVLRCLFSDASSG